MADPPWRLGGRFDLLDQLGAGASGTVWRCREASSGTEHAVKLLRPELVADEGAVAELYAALNAVAELGHPGIVAVDDAVVADGWLALRSPLVLGESLRSQLARDGMMPSAQVVPLIAQVCDALVAAHAAGIAHGSLHAANVLLTPGLDGSPRTAVLTDFGMAALVTRATQATTPEPQPTTAPADVYAVGALLYECLTGHSPSPTHPPAYSPHPQPIANITDSISDSLSRAIAACLEEDPRYRPTAAQLATTLRNELSGDSTQLLSVIPGLSLPLSTNTPEPRPPTNHPNNSNTRIPLPRFITDHKTETGIAAAVVVVSALIVAAMSMTGGSSDTTTAAATKSASAPPTAVTSPTPLAVVLPSAPRPTASPSSSTSAPTTGDMVFVNTLTNKCMDTAGRIFADGTNEDIYDCNGTPAQTWTVTATGQLTQNGGAYCLDDLGFGTTPGAKVALWSCNGGANQQWTLHPDGSITSNYANLCLDVAGQGSANGTALVLWTCDGSPSQQWSRH